MTVRPWHLLLLLVVILLAVWAVVVFGQAEGETNPRAEVTRVPVLIVMADTPSGTPIEDSVIELRQIETKFIPSSMVEDLDSETGVAVDDITANTPLTADLFE